MIAKYGEAFPLSYTTQYLAKQSVFDIEKIEEALTSKDIVVDFYRPNDVEENRVRLKVYQAGATVTLSDVMPILEDMGARVIAELPFEIKPEVKTRASGFMTSFWRHRKFTARLTLKK